MGSPIREVMYSPLEKANKKWNICVSFPHLKDAYWLAVDYGISEEAKDLGAAMHLVEAGGYTNLSKQISQIEDCASNGAQAVVIGAISLDGLNQTVKRLHDKNIPVIDLVNGISSKQVAAKSLVSFETMGYRAGEYIAKLHAKGSPETEVAWFPGPPGAGWVEAGNKGFNEAIKDSALKIIRDKTAFHYDRLNLTEAADNLASGENSIYLAQHPANSLYYMGSALVFRAAFAMIADRADGVANGNHEERVHKGTKIALDDASKANWHMHALLYGLINLLMDDVLGQPAEDQQQVRINVLDAPPPEKVGIPAFIDMG